MTPELFLRRQLVIIFARALFATVLTVLLAGGSIWLYARIGAWMFAPCLPLIWFFIFATAEETREETKKDLSTPIVK
jgi:hypothetical protein